MTTRPFFRHAWNASRRTSLLDVAAVTTTASAPKPSVSAHGSPDEVGSRELHAVGHAVANGGRDSRRVDVRADHATPRGGEQLRGELAEDAEPDDAHGLAERWLGTADTLERDRAERHRRGGSSVDTPVWDVHGEVDRNRNHLGVIRDSGAGARDQIAGRESGHLGRQPRPRRRPPSIRSADQPAGLPTDPLVRSREAVAAGDLEHTPSVLRLSECPSVER